MSVSQKQQIAINTVGFEYFSQCIKNGSTPEQAKSEMMTKSVQSVISKRVILLMQTL